MSRSAILDIPRGLTPEQLTQVLNDRLRMIQQAIPGAGPESANFDMGGFRIINLGDPKNPTDAVNLRTADARYVAKGASPTPQQVVTNATAAAISQLILTVPGVLAIQSDAAALVSLPKDATFTACILLVKQAPVGGALTIQASSAGAVLGTVTVAAGATSSTTGITWAISKGRVLTFDITGVGLTFGGSDLTIQLQQ